MIFVCTCPECGIVVRTENARGEVACGCRVEYLIIPEAEPDGDQVV